MIAFGKTLLKQSRITNQDMLRFISEPLDQQQIIEEEYSYDKSIQIVTQYELEQIIKNVPQHLQIIHALANIEYNAMKSYIDTLIRFIHNVPQQYQNQFKIELSQIAYEEFNHFTLCDQIYQYGSLPIHNNLQQRMILTNQSLLGRLAVLSIVNEGRGMDTGTNLIQKVIGYPEFQNIIKKIVKEETNHVKIGLKWFEILCLDNSPQKMFIQLMNDYQLHRNWKINIQKRKRAGFSDEWINCLQKWN